MKLSVQAMKELNEHHPQVRNWEWFDTCFQCICTQLMTINKMYEASIHILPKNTLKKDDFKYCFTYYIHNEMLGTQLKYLSTHTHKLFIFRTVRSMV